jgi:hypothetical protein
VQRAGRGARVEFAGARSGTFDVAHDDGVERAVMCLDPGDAPIESFDAAKFTPRDLRSDIGCRGEVGFRS